VFGGGIDSEGGTILGYGQDPGQFRAPTLAKPLHLRSKTADKMADTDRFACRPIPLWEQALWLARHIESVTSPRPDVVSDDEIRGLTLVRVLGIGAEEHGDSVFRKSSEALKQDAAEEWSDAEFYDLVDRFGDEIRGRVIHAT